MSVCVPSYFYFIYYLLWTFYVLQAADLTHFPERKLVFYTSLGYASLAKKSEVGGESWSQLIFYSVLKCFLAVTFLKMLD